MPQGGHLAPTASKALYHLMLACATRLADRGWPAGESKARFPVALLFLRGDRAGEGRALADQATASFEYWHKDSADALDIVFCGWELRDGLASFNLDEFIVFKNLIESASTWEYSSQTDLLLLNFDIDLDNSTASFDFSQVIVLPIEMMLTKKHIESLDGFVSELVRQAKYVSDSSRFSGASPTWKMSDNLGLKKANESIWRAIRNFVLPGHADDIENLKNLVVRNLDSGLPSDLRLDVDRHKEIMSIVSRTRRLPSG